MSRIVLVAALVGFALSAPPSSGQAKKGKSDEAFRGNLSKEKTIDDWPKFKDSFTAYASEIAVNLREGQKFSASAKMTGETHKVSICLLDPDGKTVHATDRNTAIQQVDLKPFVVGATGEYKVVVLSDQKGGFTLRHTGPLTRRELEEMRDRLKKELAEIEVALKAHDKKEEK